MIISKENKHGSKPGTKNMNNKGSGLKTWMRAKNSQWDSDTETNHGLNIKQVHTIRELMTGQGVETRPKQKLNQTLVHGTYCHGNHNAKVRSVTEMSNYYIWICVLESIYGDVGVALSPYMEMRAVWAGVSLITNSRWNCGHVFEFKCKIHQVRKRKSSEFIYTQMFSQVCNLLANTS